jgi:hypothetical protein
MGRRRTKVVALPSLSLFFSKKNYWTFTLCIHIFSVGAARFVRQENLKRHFVHYLLSHIVSSMDFDVDNSSVTSPLSLVHVEGTMLFVFPSIEVSPDDARILFSDEPK